jgi:hypothetical protein
MTQKYTKAPTLGATKGITKATRKNLWEGILEYLVQGPRHGDYRVRGICAAIREYLEYNYSPPLRAKITYCLHEELKLFCPPDRWGEPHSLGSFYWGADTMINSLEFLDEVNDKEYQQERITGLCFLIAMNS